MSTEVPQGGYAVNPYELYDLLPEPILDPSGKAVKKDKPLVPTLSMAHFTVPDIFLADLDKIPVKKWKQPNSKQSDYFNYGTK